MRAEFIGKTSMGFITGHIYTIETACKMVKRCKTSRADPVPCLCVYDKNSKAWCPYSSMEKVLENWRLWSLIRYRELWSLIRYRV